MKRLIIGIIIAASILPIGCTQLDKQADKRQELINKELKEKEKDYEVAYNPTRVVFNDYSIEETLEIADKLIVDRTNAKEAYALYKWIYEQDSTNASALIGMGYCYATLYNLPKAIEYTVKAKPYLTVGMDPKKLADAYYSIGLIYASAYTYEQDKYIKDMEEAFEKVFEVEGLNEKDKHFYYCHTYFQQVNGYNKFNLRERKKAIELLLKLNELLPNDDAVNYRLASAYISVGQLDKAKDYVDHVIKNYPHEMTKVLIQAKYYSARGEYDKAEMHFDKAEKMIQSETDKNLYYSSLLQHTVKKKDYKRTHECIQRFIDISITNVGDSILIDYAQESGFEIEERYIEAFNKSKQEAYSISLD